MVPLDSISSGCIAWSKLRHKARCRSGGGLRQSLSDLTLLVSSQLIIDGQNFQWRPTAIIKLPIVFGSEIQCSNTNMVGRLRLKPELTAIKRSPIDLTVYLVCVRLANEYNAVQQSEYAEGH